MHKLEWDFKNSRLEPDAISKFSKEFKIGYIFATILLNRGIETEDDLKKYISKSLEFVHNPNLLPDIDKAARRIVKAINEKEKIVIYGDYDADGVTSVSLLYSFLKENGADVDFYIPDRIIEGYGLNIKAINKISKLGTKLLITVDCGIASVGEVELAKAQKMDVIITDHHTCKDKIPDALAVINPKRSDSIYPFSQLAGVGVIFKTVLALAKALGNNTGECFKKYAPLAAIGTIADVVDLQDENRIIVDRGLKNLKNSSFGIDALATVSGIENKNLDSTFVSFSMAPRINAAGRMESAGTAVDLLLSDNPKKALELSEKLDKINQRRQLTEKEIYEEALQIISNDADFSNKKIIVLAQKDWHHGVIGIVASKITEQFYKPCILLSYDENGKAKGSGRSIDGVNLFDALSATQDLLTQFGGHALAAGLSLNMSDFDEFSRQINQYVLKTHPEDFKKSLKIDCSVPPSFISLENAKQLSIFEPYGMANEKPVFSMHNVKVVSASAVGQEKRHLSLTIESGGKNYRAVGFFFGHLSEYLTPNLEIDIAFNLEVNIWQGNESCQLTLKDIRKS